MRIHLNRGEEGSFTQEVRGWAQSRDDSPSQLEEVFSLVGAFPLDKGSRDCALLFRFPAGSATIEATVEAEEEAGEILIEVYYLPFE